MISILAWAAPVALLVAGAVGGLIYFTIDPATRLQPVKVEQSRRRPQDRKDSRAA